MGHEDVSYTAQLEIAYVDHAVRGKLRRSRHKLQGVVAEFSMLQKKWMLVGISEKDLT